MGRHVQPRARWVRPVVVILVILAGLTALVIVLSRVIPAAQRPTLGPAVSSAAIHWPQWTGGGRPARHQF